MATKTLVKLICHLSHERGEKVSVGDPPQEYVVGKDGVVEVEAAHADLMLQNPSKWGVYAGEPPPRIGGKRPSLPLLEGPDGEPLSEEETQRIVDENNKKAADEAAAKQKKAEEDKAAADKAAAEADDGEDDEGAGEGGDGEDPPPAWPKVSMDDKKDDLLTVAQRLVAAGFVKADAFNSKTTKDDLLEVIEQGYDKMAG